MTFPSRPTRCARVEPSRSEPKLLTNRGPSQKLHHWRAPMGPDGVQLAKEEGVSSPSSRRGRDSELVCRWWVAMRRGCRYIRFAQHWPPSGSAAAVQVSRGEGWVGIPPWCHGTTGCGLRNVHVVVREKSWAGIFWSDRQTGRAWFARTVLAQDMHPATTLEAHIRPCRSVSIANPGAYPGGGLRVDPPVLMVNTSHTRATFWGVAETAYDC